MFSLIPLLTCLLWFGPAAAALLLALILEQHRDAPNGTRPEGNIVLRCLVGGIVAALIWFVLVTLLAAITQAGIATYWIAFTPWAFALGEAVALLNRSTVTDDPKQG